MPQPPGQIDMRLHIWLLTLTGLFAASSSLEASPREAIADTSARNNPNPSHRELSSDVSNRAVGSGYGKRTAGTREPVNQAIEGEADVDASQRVGPNELITGYDNAFNTAVLGQLERSKRQEYCNGRYSQTDRNAILQYHNDMRSKIARGQYVVRGVAKSPAVNMRRLYYSCFLENSAQDVANRCTFAHSNRDGRNIGENIYRFRTPLRASPNPIPIEGTGSNACKAWEVEFEQFGWPTNLFTEYSLRTGVGHATQMGMGLDKRNA
ncbi:SCP-like protein [Ostertagia ostertagi]